MSHHLSGEQSNVDFDRLRRVSAPFRVAVNAMAITTICVMMALSVHDVLKVHQGLEQWNMCVMLFAVHVMVIAAVMLARAGFLHALAVMHYMDTEARLDDQMMKDYQS